MTTDDGADRSDRAPVIPLPLPSPGDARGRRLGGLGRIGRPRPGPGRAPATVHRLESAESPSVPPTALAPRPAWEHRLATALTFLRRRLDGQYEVDEFGFDRDLAEHVLFPALERLYRDWFRVEVTGIENLPATGGALLVANHSGGVWPIDAAMLATAVHLAHPAGRFLRILGADLIFRVPTLGPVARKGGVTLACTEDADRLLAAGELVGVWPEGFKGSGKPFTQRYRLQRFGRGGYVQAALRSGVPIVPVSIVGAEEAYPVLGNARAIARAVGLPYLPLTPTFPWLGPLGLVPLPTKWHIEFGEPIRFDGQPDDADDPMLVFDLADRVRETIQADVYRLLAQRRSVWR